MDALEKLLLLEQDELEAIYTSEADEEYKELLNGIVEISWQNPGKLKAFCARLPENDFAILQVIYYALTFIDGWHDCLFDEIQRIVSLAENKRIAPENLDVLSSIDIGDLYDKDKQFYARIIDYLFAHIRPGNDNEINWELLNLLWEYLFELDGDDDFPQMTNWINRLQELARDKDEEISETAFDVLELIADEYPAHPALDKELLKIKKMQTLFSYNGDKNKHLILWFIRTALAVALFAYFWEYKWVRILLWLYIPLNLFGLFSVLAPEYFLKRKLRDEK